MSVCVCVWFSEENTIFPANAKYLYFISLSGGGWAGSYWFLIKILIIIIIYYYCYCFTVCCFSLYLFYISPSLSLSLSLSLLLYLTPDCLCYPLSHTFRELWTLCAIRYPLTSIDIDITSNKKAQRLSQRLSQWFADRTSEYLRKKNQKKY